MISSGCLLWLRLPSSDAEMSDPSVVIMRVFLPPGAGVVRGWAETY